MDNGADGVLFGNVASLLERGYGLERALATALLRHTLIQGISTLTEPDNAAAEAATQADIVIVPTDIAIGTGPDALPGNLLIDSDILPLWKEFAEALCQFAANGHGHGSPINLVFQNVGLTREVLDILEPALRAARFKVLGFSNTGIGRDGTTFMARLLEKNPSIRNLSLERNEIECGPEMLSLLEAVRKHAGLQVLDMDHCGIGGKLSASPEIVPALLRLQSVHLAGNGIGSHGADLICRCLETDPDIKQFYLNENNLNDEDAILFASALKRNTNLLQLSLHGNNFTDVGVKTLYRSIYDDQSLNSIHSSNHTCWMELFADGQTVPIGIYEEVLSLNGKRIESSSIPRSALRRIAETASRDKATIHKTVFSEGRKKIKILLALQGRTSSHFNAHYLRKVSLKLMPRVLLSLQESGSYAGAEERNLDSLFQIICSRPADFCGRLSEDTSVHGAYQTKMWFQWPTRKLLDFFIPHCGKVKY